MGKFEEAVAEYDRVAAQDRQFPGLALERGLLFEATNRVGEALEFYKEALSKAPDDPDLMLRVGSAEVSSGRASQAEEILRKVILKRPNSAEANHWLGRALLLRGSNLAEAVRMLKLAVERDPNRADYRLYYGWAANEAGQPALAKEELDQALELDKGLADAYWQKGVLARKQGAVLDAMRYAQKALELRPTRYEAWATLAECYEDQNRVGDAIEAWKKAIAADGGVAEWHYRLGKLAGANGYPELVQAVALAEQLEVKPGWLAQGYFELAEAERANGKRVDAVQHYRRFMSLAKADSPYRIDAINALKALGSPYEH
jgi:tetratricopeptide (TPR) repeat protein